VVSYESAHIDGVTSELIVHSEYSKDTLKQSRMCAEFSESTSKQNNNSV